MFARRTQVGLMVCSLAVVALAVGCQSAPGEPNEGHKVSDPGKGARGETKLASATLGTESDDAPNITAADSKVGDAADTNAADTNATDSNADGGLAGAAPATPVELPPLTDAIRKTWPPASASTARLPDMLPFSYFTTEPLKGAIKKFHAGKNAAAATLFDGFVRSSYPEDPRHLPARFMAQLSRHDAGDCAATPKALEKLAGDWPLMATYARFFAASCYQKSGRLDDLYRIVGAESDWRVLRGRVAALVTSAGDFDKPKGQAALKSLDIYERPVRKVSVYTTLLKHALKTKDAAQAQKLRVLLVEHFTDTRRGREALKKLPDAKKLDGETNLKLGRALFDGHFHKDAVKRLKAAADQHPRFSEPRCEALMKLGRTHDKMKRRSVAWRYHSQALGCKGESLFWATFAGGKNRFKVGEFATAERVLKRHMAVFGDRTTADDAALMIALGRRDRGDNAGATAMLETMLKKWPEGDKADEAAWQLVWPHIKAKRWRKVSDIAEGLVNTMRRETHFRAEGRVRYWLGVALLKRGKVKGAGTQFRAVIEAHPFSWYAVLAYSRLHASAPATAAKFIVELDKKRAASQKDPDLLMADKAWFKSHPAFHRAVELLRMGLKGTARRELGAMPPPGASDPDNKTWAWSRAWVLDAAGAHPPATVITRKEEPFFGALWPVAESKAAELWRLAHPRPFSKSVRKWAKVRKVDPYWLWSIMREESNFNAGAVSWANAYGAMQIIMGTAKALARGEGIEISRRKLFDPEISVRLGSRYLGGLLRKFGRIPIASPGYNAGGGAVNKWRRSPLGAMELDAFVEHIPYDEARGYAKRVTRSVARYQWLYEGKVFRLDLSPPRASGKRGKPKK